MNKETFSQIWNFLPPTVLQVGFSQICLFHNSHCQKDDHTDFAQEERLGVPYWTMIWAICVVVDESKMSGHSDLGFFKNLRSILHFYLGISRYLRPAGIVPAHPVAVWIWYPWLVLPSFVMLMILVRWILHKIHISQYHLGIQLDLCIFGALPPIQHFSNDRCPSVRRNELLRPSSLLHRSPVSYFWLWSSSTPKFSPIFSHSLSTAAFAAWIFMAWGIGINLWNQIIMLCGELVSFSCNIVFMMSRQWFSHTQSCRFTSFRNTRKFLIWLYWMHHSHNSYWFLRILQGIAGSPLVMFPIFLRAFLMVSLNSLSSASMNINSS